MATYLFKVEWVKQSYKRVDGYLISSKTGERISTGPDYKLLLGAGKYCQHGCCKPHHVYGDREQVISERHWHITDYTGDDVKPPESSLAMAKRVGEIACDRDNWVR